VNYLFKPAMSVLATVHYISFSVFFSAFRQSAHEAAAAGQVQPPPLTPVRYFLQNFHLSRLIIQSPIICLCFDRLLLAPV